MIHSRKAPKNDGSAERMPCLPLDEEAPLTQTRSEPKMDALLCGLIAPDAARAAVLCS